MPARADRAGSRAGRSPPTSSCVAGFRCRGSRLVRSAERGQPQLHRARPPRAERAWRSSSPACPGSGKSTIARGLAEALTQRGDRTVSLLDGDHVPATAVRRGRPSPRADPHLNIARIGHVVAEVARHGGIAICAPIAPYAAARGAAARQMVTEVGDFLLVYVSTPVDVCAARDRKGLYAKARAGLITGFTGVSDPYEEPGDADLVLDTSVMTRQQAVDAVLKLLTTWWLARHHRTRRHRSGQGHPADVSRNSWSWLSGGCNCVCAHQVPEVRLLNARPAAIGLPGSAGFPGQLLLRRGYLLRARHGSR